MAATLLPHLEARCLERSSKAVVITANMGAWMHIRVEAPLYSDRIPLSVVLDIVLREMVALYPLFARTRVTTESRVSLNHLHPLQILLMNVEAIPAP